MSDGADSRDADTGGADTGGAATSGTGFLPPTKDPWKGLRGVMAGTLILEAIVVLLALPVVNTVGGGLTAVSATYVIGLAVLMCLGSGVQGKAWGIWFDIALQAGMIAGFVIHPALGVMGLVFGAVWAYVFYLRRDIQERIDHGMLPGQRG